MQSELKPCPFCGGNAEHMSTSSSWVRCEDCGAEIQCQETKEDAVRMWNRRAALSDQERAVEADTGTLRTHIGKSTANDCWFVRVYPCLSENDARSVQSRIRSALVDVPVEPVQDDIVGYVMRYGGMCRDCADMNGVCQSGQPCDTDQRRAVVRHTISALAYGIKNGFIASPFQSSHREGEGSAKVIPAGLVERCAEILEWKKTGRLPGDALRELGRSIADRLGSELFIDNGLNQAELATVDEALNLIVALAATRSGSASTAKGCDE